MTKRTPLQGMAQQRNWALFQLKAARGNLSVTLAKAGVDPMPLMAVLTTMETKVLQAYTARKLEHEVENL